MFPHTVTVFNVTDDNGSITYNRTVVENVFFDTNIVISQEGKGEKFTSVYDVIFPLSVLNDSYSLRKNDIIVLGKYEDDISNLNDIQTSSYDYFLIKEVRERLYGSEELQNIEVLG